VIQAEAATVYRAGGRRYLTARAAAGAAARSKIKERCACDYCDHDELPGSPREDLPCSYHNGSERAEQVLKRLTRIYLRAFRRAEPVGAERKAP
jgi:hypothetical protein